MRWVEGGEGKEHVLPSSPSEGDMSFNRQPEGILAEHLQLSRNVLGFDEVIYDVAKVTADSVKAPDDEARPNIDHKPR